MATYVLDTSAIMCILLDEEGAQVVVGLLEAARSSSSEERSTVLLPFVALMEVEYSLLRRLPTREVERHMFTVERWPAQVRESNVPWRRQAARVKAGGGLSLADAWIAALAIQEGGELVHKDPEFDQVDGLRSLRLPYR
ncbi:MAG: PIN domain-containing protein [Chloroflexi bacterium]|nr:PIN domain-containing protein [Chloroflexota bacterium]